MVLQRDLKIQGHKRVHKNNLINVGLMNVNTTPQRERAMEKTTKVARSIVRSTYMHFN